VQQSETWRMTVIFSRRTSQNSVIWQGISSNTKVTYRYNKGSPDTSVTRDFSLATMSSQNSLLSNVC
jgi:hypothetical protein